MAKQGYALTGDWNRLRGFLKGGQGLVDLVNETLQEEAQKIRDAIENEIPYDAVPNAPRTVKNKGFNAPLLESGTYGSEGIVVNEYSARDKGFKKYYIIEGNKDKLVESGDRPHDGLTYAGLLEIMEEGRSNTGRGSSIVIPKRPIVTITFDRMKASLESEIIAKTRSAIHEAIR